MVDNLQNFLKRVEDKTASTSTDTEGANELRLGGPILNPFPKASRLLHLPPGTPSGEKYYLSPRSFKGEPVVEADNFVILGYNLSELTEMTGRKKRSIIQILRGLMDSIL